MKIEKTAIDVIRNFSVFNPGLVVKRGNVLMSKHASATMVAKATFHKFEFDCDFAIWNLSKFLSAVSLFDNPEILVDGEDIKITSGTSKATFRKAAPNLIVHHDYAKQNVKLNTFETFDLTKEQLKSIQKALSVFSSKDVTMVLRGDGNRISVGTYDTSNPQSDRYMMDIGSTDKDFKIMLTIDSINFSDKKDYVVTIGDNKMIEFTTSDDDVTLNYWIGAHKDSEIR